MKSYGKFEAVREVCQTPVAAIWTARLVGTPGAAGACVKVIQPDAPVFAGKGAIAAEELLVSAALQQSIANKSEHWAPVYELGYDGDNAFYVGRLFDRTLQRLIDLKAKFSSADLLIVTSAIVEGLTDLRSAFDRSHGNLKPANVLIAGKGRIRREDIRLTDPHSGDEDLATMTRSPDVKAIGEILFALVTGRPHTAARWPVQESVEWDRLGSSGAQWLELCNDLLNTMARQGPMSLGRIQARLSAMRLGRRRMPRIWFAAAAMLAVASGGYLFRDQVRPWADRGKQWAASLHQHPATAPAFAPWPENRSASQPIAVARPPGAIAAGPVPTVVPTISPIPKPAPAVATVKPVQPAAPVALTPPTVPQGTGIKPSFTPPATSAPAAIIAAAPTFVSPPTRTMIPGPGTAPVPLAAVTPVTTFTPPVALRPAQPPAPASLPAVIAAPAVPASVAVVAATPLAPMPVPQPQPVIHLPAFLTGTSAAKFLDTVSQLSTPEEADRRTKFVQSVNGLDSMYPATTIRGDRPWQKELSKLIDARRQLELTTAVTALADSLEPDPANYRSFVASAQAFGSEAADAEDAINTASSWAPESHRAGIDKTLRDEQSLLADPKVRATAAPPVLDEFRAIDDAIAAQNPKALLGILHDQNSSLPARVAAWQALDLPGMGERWPMGREEFVAGQKDGDSLIAAASGTNLNTKTAISDYQDRRLKAFYATLNTEPLVTDAVTHLADVEGTRISQRPSWLEFDRIIYGLIANRSSASDADMKALKSLSATPAAAELYAALEKAKIAASNDQPLDDSGPGRMNWTARPFNAAGIRGCLYSSEGCPPIEFIRVEPGAGKGKPFYLSTTEVPVGLISDILSDPTRSAPTATDAIKALNPPQSAASGAHLWKFSASKGIELDPTSYLQYFRQSPTADLPIQQITPQAALYLARNLGCRLPSSSEWTAALAKAYSPPTADDPIKGFATSAWKLRDADFASLVDKASLNQRYPDEAIFLGPDPSLIPAGSTATIWSAPAVRRLGGWTVSDLKTDRQAQRQMARLDESSSDFRADLIDVAQLGFRPVGNTHHVFHDLIGNVAEFVLDTSASDEDLLPSGTKITAKDIVEFFGVGDRAKQLGVIGGSFLSPPELDPTSRIALPSASSNPACADVGFRLAFTDPRAVADPSAVIKQTGYLYPPSVAKPLDSAP